MKRIITAALILAACSAIAAPPPAYRITIERQSIGDAPQLKAFEASAFTLQVQFTDGANPVVLGAGDVPFAYWAWSNKAAGQVPAAWSSVSAASGTVLFSWTASDMNTNGVAMYGVGITDSNNETFVMKHGAIVITPDPYANDAPAVTYATNVINMALATYLNKPWFETVSIVTGSTWGATIITNHLALSVSTNATGELDPVWLSEKGDYLTTAAAALAYATTGSVAAKVDSSTFASTNSGLQAQINGLVASAGWTQAVIQGETSFITSSNTARLLYLTISGIGAKADSNEVWSTFLKIGSFSTYTGTTATALAGKLDAASYSNSAVATDRVSLVTYTANRLTDTNRIASVETNVAARLPTATYTANRATDTAAVAAVSAGIAVADYATNYQNRVQQGTNNVAMQARIAAVEIGKADVNAPVFTNGLRISNGGVNVGLPTIAGTWLTNNALVFPSSTAPSTIRQASSLVLGFGTVTDYTTWLYGRVGASNLIEKVVFDSSTNDLYRGITNRAPYAEYKSTSNEVATLNTAAVLRAGGVAYGTHTFGQLIATNSLIVAATNSGLGAELVTDGGFAASPPAWVFVAAYTNNGRTLVDAGNSGTIRKNSATDSPPVSAHASYQVSYSNCLDGAGAVRLEIGGVTNYQAFSGSRHYTFLATPKNDNSTFTLTVYATNQMAIDNISVKKVGGADSVVSGDFVAGGNSKAGGTVYAGTRLVVGDATAANATPKGIIASATNSAAVSMCVFNTDATNSGWSDIKIGSDFTSVPGGGYAAFLCNNSGFIPAGEAGGTYDYYQQPEHTWIEARNGGDFTIAHYGSFGTVTPNGHSGTIRIVQGGTDLRYHTRMAVSNDGSVHFSTNRIYFNGPEFHHGPVVVSNTLRVEDEIRVAGTIRYGNSGYISESGLVSTGSFGGSLSFEESHLEFGTNKAIRNQGNGWEIADAQLIVSNGTLYVNGTNVLGQAGSGAPTNAFSPTWISQDAGGTVTLYRAGINYFSASRTNPITITFATNDWGTDRMTVALDLLAGTGSVTWLAATVANTGTASSTNLGTLSTTATVPLLLDKTSGNLFPARVYNLAK